MQKNGVFTIVAKNYIGLAQILEQSIRKHYTDFSFYIFVADEFSENEGIELTENIIIASQKLDISAKDWEDMSFKYNLTEFCTSIKPSAFSYLFKQTKHDKIIYLDPDIFFYSSISPVFDMLSNHAIVLTPHILYAQEHFKGERSESGLMSTGVFNLGFCGMSRSNTTDNILSWWHQRLRTQCYIDSSDSFFTDQKWMDFLPCLVDSDQLLISRHPGMNIAPWNYYERMIFQIDEQLMVCSRENKENLDLHFPVMFVHYSGYNYNELEKGNIIQNNIEDLDKYEDINLLTKSYAKTLQHDSIIFNKFIALKYSYNYYENYVSIQGFHRRLYRSLIAKGETISEPFKVGPNSFYERLKKSKMIIETSINLDKVTKNNLAGVNKQLILFNRLMRLVFNLIGYQRYLLLVRLFRPFSRNEAQIHLLDKRYDSNNIFY